MPIDVLYFDLIHFPATMFARMRSLPFPAPFPPLQSIGTTPLGSVLADASTRLGFYFPAVSLIGLCWVLARRRSELDPGFRRAAAGIAVVLLMLHNHLRVRADVYHLFAPMTAAVLAYACVLHQARTRRHVAVVGLALTLYGLVAWTPVSQKLQMASVLLNPGAMYPMALPRAAGIVGFPGYDQYELCIAYVMKHVPPAEKIFVGNTRHDRVTRNDEMFYFLSERDSATRHHQLHPGITTTLAIQEEMIRDIRRENVRYVVLVDLDAEEPNESGRSSGVVLLDEFIRANFKPCATFGIWTVGFREGDWR